MVVGEGDRDASIWDRTREDAALPEHRDRLHTHSIIFCLSKIMPKFVHLFAVCNKKPCPEIMNFCVKRTNENIAMAAWHMCFLKMKRRKKVKL